MRKVLLATTALIGVALAGSAHAAAPSSPISLNVGGYNDFVAGFFQESQSPAGVVREGRSFEDEFKISFDAMGKASNGIEYGANISLWNGPEITNFWQGGGNGVTINTGYVWMSGAFGKVLLGDEHGASDLFVYAPTVGEGQLDGRYMDFVNPFTLARIMPSGIDNTEHSTKITYYTPKVGNDQNKVQLGVSYIPNMYDYGQGGIKEYNVGVPAAFPAGFTGAQGASPYQDVVKAAAEYWANYHPVHAALSGQFIEGQGSVTPLGATNVGVGLTGTGLAANKALDFYSWGLGGQLGIDQVSGLTLGASYNDLGHYDMTHGQNKNQDVYNVGAKYEFDKVGVAVNYINASEYDDMLAVGGIAHAPYYDYVSEFNGYGAGATYTWFPGLTSNVDGVMFNQKVDNSAIAHNDGYVVLLSQKLTF